MKLVFGILYLVVGIALIIFALLNRQSEPFLAICEACAAVSLLVLASLNFYELSQSK